MRKPTSKLMASTTTTTTPCCTKIGLKRGPWTPEEDTVLSNYISKEGEGRWRTLPKRAGLLRCGKSCRLRWMNYLRPSVKRGQIASDEEDLILRLHRLLGNRWSLIAGRIPGRTDNEIKNYWNTHLSKKLISQGIDPRTHKPLSNTTVSTDHQLMTTVKPSATTADKNHCNNPSNLLLVNGRVSTASPDTISGTGLLVNVTDGNPPGLVHGYVGDGDDHFQSMMNSVTLVGHGSNTFLNICNNNDDNQDQHDEEINYSCGGEDVFSSFLNSLINEDDNAFINNGHTMIQPLHNQLMQAQPHDEHHQPMILNDITIPSSQSSDAFGYVNINAGIGGNNWEITAAAPMSDSSNAVFGEQSICGRIFTNQHDDQRQ